MAHKEFLEKFDSLKDAGAAFNVSPLDIGHWKARGIPCWYWFLAERIAIKRGWRGITAESLCMTHPKNPVRK